MMLNNVSGCIQSSQPTTENKNVSFVSHRETAQLQECSLVFHPRIVKIIIYYFSDKLYLNKHRSDISNVQHQWIRPFFHGDC